MLTGEFSAKEDLLNEKATAARILEELVHALNNDESFIFARVDGEAVHVFSAASGVEMLDVAESLAREATASITFSDGEVGVEAPANEEAA